MGTITAKQATNTTLKQFIDILGFKDQFLTNKLTLTKFASNIQRFMNPSLASAIAYLIYLLNKDMWEANQLKGRLFSDLARGNAKGLGYTDWDEEHEDEVEYNIFIVSRGKENGEVLPKTHLISDKIFKFFTNMNDATLFIKGHRRKKKTRLEVFEATLYIKKKKVDVNWEIGIPNHGKYS